MKLERLEELLNDVWPGEEPSTAYRMLIDLLATIGNLTGVSIRDLVRALDELEGDAASENDVTISGAEEEYLSDDVEAFWNDGAGEVTYYFAVTKEFLEKYLPGRYPEAIAGDVQMTMPIKEARDFWRNHNFAADTGYFWDSKDWPEEYWELSPVRQDESGYESYDVAEIEIAPKDRERLLRMLEVRKFLKDGVSKYDY